jgi:beta-glucanase (GH16 family)
MNPKGGHVQTNEKFLYGRFETMMCPAFGSGIVSSFFLFDDSPGFQTKWNEIDFEFLGRNTNQVDTNIIRTLNGHNDKSGLVKQITLDRRSSDVFWKLGIEWFPDRVKWYINDIGVRVWYGKLDQAQKLMMNIWVGNPAWAGEYKTGVLPQVAFYKYVRYSAYQDGKFVYKWQDDFTNQDTKRWTIATWPLEGTNLVKENAQFGINGQLVLTLK